MIGAPVSEITIVVVSWNDAVETEACVAALASARLNIPTGGPRVSLVVVDNGGNLLERGRVRAEWPDARLIVNETNRGLAPAANQAAAAASGEILLFLNPDTRPDGEPFGEIARAFAERAGAVAVAPRLLDADLDSQASTFSRLAPPDREDQFTFQLRRLPGLASDARHLLLIDHLVPNNRGRRRDRYADRDRETEFSVEQAAGAALAVAREAFVGVGGFDERFVPAWFEDVDLCARLLRRGEILYWPAARFRHSGGASASELGYARFLPIYYRNALRYRERYSAPARGIYRGLLACGMLLRLFLLPFRPTVPRSRREAARAYLSTLGIALFPAPHRARVFLNNSQRP